MSQRIPRHKRLGQTFGRLTVVGLPPSAAKIECRCECGVVREYYGYNIFGGTTKSCGCYHVDAATAHSTSHGHSKTHPLYYTWKNVRNRCRNPNVPGYKYYGGKGITICPEWDDFDVFRAWAESAGYEKGLTIDRINPELDYYPENCQFITQSQNSWRRWHPDAPLSEYGKHGT